RGTGTIDALIGRTLKRFGHKPHILIFMVVFCFALASGAIGTAGVSVWRWLLLHDYPH
ncbi:MAG: putative ion transporter superfamily protein YfcC, partial [Pseudomonadales bacterium]